MWTVTVLAALLLGPSTTPAHPVAPSFHPRHRVCVSYLNTAYGVHACRRWAWERTSVQHPGTRGAWLP